MADMFYMKRGDTVPAIRRQLLSGDGQPVDVTGAEVTFSMGNYRGVAIMLEPCQIVSGTEGIVQYQWKTGDTELTGKFSGEFQVVYPNGGIETFPNSSFVTINITRDIA